MAKSQTGNFLTNPVPASTTRTKATEGSGLIVALMGTATVFSLLGHEIENRNPNAGLPAGQFGPWDPSTSTPPQNASQVISTGGRIVLGGTLATFFLTLLTHTGDTGRQFAVGLALVAFVTSTLVYGAPVWEAMNNAFGSKPSRNSGNTSPTGGAGGTMPLGGTGQTASTLGTGSSPTTAPTVGL